MIIPNRNMQRLVDLIDRADRPIRLNIAYVSTKTRKFKRFLYYRIIKDLKPKRNFFHVHNYRGEL